MKRVIVTGAAGFVGANLVRRLLLEDHHVYVLLRKPEEAWRLEDIRDDLCVSKIDLSDQQAVKEAVRTVKPDWIFHLAAHGAYSHQNDMGQMIGTNVTGTSNLVDVCVEQGFEAFVNAGSSSEYGYRSSPPSEDDRIDPNSPYAVTKSFGTQYCAFAARKHNMHIVTLRLYSAYGPYEDKGRFIPTLVSQAINGHLPPLVAPDTARDFVYVDDVCEAFMLAATKAVTERGLVFNVGTGIQTTIRQAVDIAIDVFGIKESPEWNTMPGRQWDTDKWVADISRIKRCLGWTPTVSLQAGLKQTAEWIRSCDNP
jgi:UDP-glucose 4-epimerase